MSRSQRTKFRPDSRNTWPHFKHPGEVGGGPHDCQFCGSPRVFHATDVRICASCGYHQKPSDICLICGCGLNSESRDMKLGLCTDCRMKEEEKDRRAEQHA